MSVKTQWLELRNFTIPPSSAEEKRYNQALQNIVETRQSVPIRIALTSDKGEYVEADIVQMEIK